METDPTLSALVDQYQVVFKEPKGLPPFREHDHHILTPKDAKPMCVGPYYVCRALLVPVLSKNRN